MASAEAKKGRTSESKLRIRSCAVVFQGEYPNGHKYRVYRIEAERPDGSPVNEALRSFEALPEGEVLDLDVTKHEGEHGTNYLLARKGVDRIQQLDARVREIETILGIGMETGDGAS